jgi:ribosomal protein S18 acetylase RimI-like enzyme
LASSAPGPPAGYAARAATHDDLPAIDELYLASERAMGLERPEKRSGYLGFRWSQPYTDLARDTRVIDGPDGLAAFAMAFVEPETPSVASCMGRVHPDHLGRGLGAWALAFFEHRARAGGRPIARLGIEEPDEAGHALVNAHGYVRVRNSYDMGVVLRDDETPGPEPAGVRVRAFEPGEERVVWAITTDAFRDHWDHEADPSFESFYGDWFEDPGHPPAILVAEVDGEPDGVIGWIVDDGVPYVFSVGVRRRARGRGVATSLLEHAKARAAADGFAELTLSVDAANPTGALRAYEKVGMTVRRTVIAYQRDLA